PVQPPATAVEILEQLTLQAFEVAAVLLGLDAGHPEQPGGGHALTRQVLDERHAVLGAGDQDRTQRRREDAVAEDARAEVGQPRDETLAGGVGVAGRRRRGPQGTDRAVDGAIAREIVAAGCAGRHVGLHPLGRRLSRLPRRRGDEVRLDRDTHPRLAGHRVDSVRGWTWPSRVVRILRSAWKTWARALSGEHSRLCPMAS